MGFGGGMGKNGLVCGVVTAGIMAIGLQAKGKEKAEVYKLVDTFLTDFKAHFGTVNCRELLGADLKTEEGMDYLKTEGRKKCKEFVRYAADAVGQIYEKFKSAIARFKSILQRGICNLLPQYSGVYMNHSV